MQLVKLCSIFPEEVWEMIFDRIVPSTGIYNVIIALPYLLQVPKFQRQKPKWLFAEVLPLVSEHLGVPGVLSCRLVCKQWNKTLHSFVSNHSCHQPYNEDPHNPLPINTAEVNQKCPLFKLATSDPVLHFRTADSMEHFMEISRNTQFLRDPVFGNTIYFDPEVNQNNSRIGFNQSSLAILTEFGNIIMHLVLSSDKAFETPQQFYIRICNYLQRTPNLKSLSLLFENQDDSRDLSAIVHVKPLPVLPFLQSLHIKIKENHGTQKNIMQTFILHDGNDIISVRKLKLELQYSNSPWDQWDRPCLLRLTDLEIRSREDICFSGNLKDSNLQKLTIHVGGAGEGVFKDCLNGKYGENLRVLKFCNSSYNEKTPLDSVNIKNLHTLRIQNLHCLNYEFLPKLSSLVKLELSCSNDICSLVDDEKWLKKKIGNSMLGLVICRWIYDGTGPNISSVIWEWLPNLQEFRIPKKIGGKWILQSFLRPHEACNSDQKHSSIN